MHSSGPCLDTQHACSGTPSGLLIRVPNINEPCRAPLPVVALSDRAYTSTTPLDSSIALASPTLVST